MLPRTLKQPSPSQRGGSARYWPACTVVARPSLKPSFHRTVGASTAGISAETSLQRSGWEPSWEPFGVDRGGHVWTLVESEANCSATYGRTPMDAAWRSTDQEVGCSSRPGRAADDETDPCLESVGGRACWLSAASPRRLCRWRHRSVFRWLGGHLDWHGGQDLHASRVALFEGHVAPTRHLVEGAGDPGIDHV